VRDAIGFTCGSQLLSHAAFLDHLYEYNLVAALEDLLRATACLPGFSVAWMRAGEALGEYKQFSSAIEYYEVHK
jgi:hypothetical protein